MVWHWTNCIEVKRQPCWPSHRHLAADYDCLFQPRLFFISGPTPAASPSLAPWPPSYRRNGISPRGRVPTFAARKLHLWGRSGSKVGKPFRLRHPRCKEPRPQVGPQLTSFGRFRDSLSAANEWNVSPQDHKNLDWSCLVPYCLAENSVLCFDNLSHVCSVEL